MNYPYYLLTAQVRPTRMVAVALKPVQMGLVCLRTAAILRLRAFVFPFVSSADGSRNVFRTLADTYGAGVLHSVRLSQVRLAASKMDAEEDEVPYLWEFPDDPRLRAGAPGWGAIDPSMPVTIRSKDAPPEPFEVFVLAPGSQDM